MPRSQLGVWKLPQTARRVTSEAVTTSRRNVHRCGGGGSDVAGSPAASASPPAVMAAEALLLSLPGWLLRLEAACKERHGGRRVGGGSTSGGGTSGGGGSGGGCSHSPASQSNLQRTHLSDQGAGAAPCPKSLVSFPAQSVDGAPRASADCVELQRLFRCGPSVLEGPLRLVPLAQTLPARFPAACPGRPMARDNCGSTAMRREAPLLHMMYGRRRRHAGGQVEGRRLLPCPAQGSSWRNKDSKRTETPAGLHTQ